MSARIKAHMARFHPRGDWTPAMMMAAIQEHEAELARLKSMMGGQHVAPLEIADLVQFGETYEQTNARLLPLYREAQHMKEMAIEDGDKTARVRWETKIRNIDTTMHWMHGRRIETI